MDNKLTDNEIIKALEQKIKFKEFDESEDAIIKVNILENVLDLINRLQAENEVYETCNARKDEAIKSLESRLKKLQMKFDDISKMYSEIKAEAYKECIEKVKALFPSDNEPYQYWEIHEGADNLLKELVGE